MFADGAQRELGEGKSFGTEDWSKETIVNKAGEKNLELGTESMGRSEGGILGRQGCAGRRGDQACVWLKRGKTNAW